MNKVEKAQQNFTLPLEVVNNLRTLSDYRKFKGKKPATMAAIVQDLLVKFLEENKSELQKAKLLLADDSDDTAENSVQSIQARSADNPAQVKTAEKEKSAVDSPSTVKSGGGHNG